VKKGWFILFRGLIVMEVQKAAATPTPVTVVKYV
jgi:hypothetical protein